MEEFLKDGQIYIYFETYSRRYLSIVYLGSTAIKDKGKSNMATTHVRGVNYQLLAVMLLK